MSLSLVLFGLFFSLLATGVFGKTIVVYHTNDVHGWIASRPAVWNKAHPERRIGGYPIEDPPTVGFFDLFNIGGVEKYLHQERG
jgi:hypothetical protein